MFADISAQHWAFAIYVIGAITICLVMIGLAALLGGRAYGRTKNKPFESGVDSVGSARLRFSAKFYLVAMFFVIFDVEALYLFTGLSPFGRAAGSALLKPPFSSDCCLSA